MITLKSSYYYARRFQIYLRQMWNNRQLIQGRGGMFDWLSRFPDWQRSLDTTPISDRRPWMTFTAIDWLSEKVQKDLHVFEFSSGGSTLFFVDRGVKLISVEHDPLWYENVRAILSNDKYLSRCDYRLIVPEITSGIPFAPSKRFSKPNADFNRYAQAIDEFPDGTFDLISIDGRARVECARHSIKKVKRGGFVVLDNSDRDDYKEIFEILAAWKRNDFYGMGPYNYAPWQTTVWELPV